MKCWREVSKKTVQSFNLLVWCSEDELLEFNAKHAMMVPKGSTWSTMYKSRDDGPLFWYPDFDEYLWFFNGERMNFEMWFSYISFDNGNGPRRTEEEQAMLLLQYA